MGRGESFLEAFWRSADRIFYVNYHDCVQKLSWRKHSGRHFPFLARRVENGWIQQNARKRRENGAFIC